MPPKGRSSSSRSSSHRSSSRSSSSSRSRSSSRSSSSRSSNSSRSSSSRSSSSSSKSYRSTTNTKQIRSKTSAKAISFAKNYKRPIRNRPSFVSRSKEKPVFHHCLKHDYYYYKNDFFDLMSNTTYKKGFYDENGNHYDNLNLNYANKETVDIIKCEYCGSSQSIDLKNIELNQTLKCANCGAILNIDNIIGLNTDYYVCDEKENFPNEEFEIFEIRKKNILSNYYFKTMLAYLLVFIMFIFLIILPKNNDSYINTNETNINNNTYYDYDTFGNNLYVPEIDRTCFWDGDYYYDELTDCYFCFNTDITPPQMQYWYEDFSSDYGDYGWLEYDSVENKWYVEVSDNNWIIVDNPPNYFWHTSYDSLLKGNN